MRKYTIILLFILTAQLNAQYYLTGTDPESIKWSKIETPHFKLVFSRKYEIKAQYIANLLEEVYRYGGLTLNHSPEKINVLIHSDSSYSNGFVTWAPKRMELFTAPNQDTYAQGWLKQLATHEFRHVVQIDKLNIGFTKFLSYIFGQQAIGGVLGLYAPRWFLEGDAVTTETALSKSGRGRLPRFEQAMRAQVMDKKTYSYEKACFGSYRNYVPDYYQMGYQFVAGARAKYGSKIWESALKSTGGNPFITPFNRGIKKVSGLNKTTLYKDVFNDLKSKWIKQDSLFTKVKFYPVTKIDKSFLNFKYPHVLNDSTVIAELSGPGEVDRFVSVGKKGEYKTIYTPGMRSEEPFSMRHNIICWAEQAPDIRWDNRKYSVIKTYNLKTKKLNRVTKKTNYFSPAINPNAKTIAVVKLGVDDKCSLVILDAKTGKEKQSFSYVDDAFICTPQWNVDGTKIVCVVLGAEGKQIVELNVKDKKWNNLTKPSHIEVRLPHYYGDNVLFTGSYSGLEEIYKLQPNKKITQLTQSRFGAAGAVIDSNYMYYSNYTADGYQLVKLKKTAFINKPLVRVKDESVALYKIIAAQEKRQPNFNDSLMQHKNYTSTKYSKWNLFNVHSWAPMDLDVRDHGVSPGASLMSQNLLGTMVSSVGYNADPQESREKYYFNLEYQGWYPIFDFTVKHGDEKINYDKNVFYVNKVDTFSLDANAKQIQTSIETSIRVPINMTKGRYSNLLEPSIRYTFLHRTAFDVNKTLYTLKRRQLRHYMLIPKGSSVIKNPEVNYNSIEYGLYFHHLKSTSNRDVSTRWGQVIELKYANTPLGGYDAGGIFGVKTTVFIPGFMKHHTIRIENDYQNKFKGDVVKTGSAMSSLRYGDLYNYPRGYERGVNDKMYSLKTDYIFPLINPDITISGLLYLKRVTTNVFFDYTETSLGMRTKIHDLAYTYKQKYKSAGFELRGTCHLLRFLFPITIGYRYSHLLTINKNKHELLMGISLSGMGVNKNKRRY